MRLVQLSLFVACAMFACGDQADPARPGRLERAEPGPPPNDTRPMPSPSTLARIRPPVDVVSTAGAIDEWPRIVPGVEARAFTSYDRGGGNDDGFGGTYSELYEEDGRHVIFDAIGPGVLRTLWFASAIDGNGPLSLGEVRFTFDEETSPRFVVDADALFAGATSPFVAPLAVGNQVSSGGFASWVPLAYRSRLRITTAIKPGFYQAHYDTLPSDWDVTSGPARAVDLATKFASVGAANPFSTLALEEIALDHSASGAGTIDVLRFEPTAGTATRAELQTARIQIFFDGVESAPQVDVPLGMFFGSGLGETTVRAAPWSMDVGRYESRLPMPYWNGVRIVVTGLAGKLFIHTTDALEPRSDYGTLHAIESVARPTEAGKDFVYAKLAGAGKLVGTVLAVEPRTASEKQWWEGDLASFVDGATMPNIHGTGHEDDHLGGWSNEFLERPFSLAMQGCPKTVIRDQPVNGQTNADASMYRLFAGVPFLHALTHVTEHGPSNQRQSNYSSAAFLYLQSRDRLVETTAAVPFDRTRTVAIRADNEGVKLRFAFDGSEARRVRVIVDNVVAGTWYVPRNAAPPSTVTSDFFIPAQLTKGKTELALSFVAEGTKPPSTVAAWSVLP